jgi:gliding motility-associated-like protein
MRMILNFRNYLSACLLFMINSGLAQINVVERFESENLVGWTLDSTSTFWWPAQTNFSIDGKSLQLCYRNDFGIVRGGYSSQDMQVNDVRELTAQKTFTGTIQATNLVLYFKWRCNGEEGRDYGSVFCKGSTTNWYEIKSNVRSNNPDEFYQEVIALPSCMDRQNDIKILFKFRNDAALDFQPGFVIDDVMLKGSNCATPPANPTISNTYQFCYSDQVKVNISANSAVGNLLWYESNQCASPFAEGLNLSVFPLQDKTYYAKSVNSSGCLSTGFVAVPVNVIMLPKVTVGQLSNTTFGDDGMIEVSAIGETANLNYQWLGPFGFTSNNPDIYGVNEGLYELVVTDGYGCQSYNRYFIEEGSELSIPKVITPNGDGKNDVWSIKGIEQWHDVELYIFDQNEALVYSQIVYPGSVFTEWDGTNMDGKILLPGDYFFVFISKEKGRKEKGVITVIYE